MKATIHIDNKEIFSSNRISCLNLNKKVDELKRVNNVMKILDQVKRNFKIFTS